MDLADAGLAQLGRESEAVGEQPQSTRALGDQDAAVGQERHAPRVLEALGEGHDAERTRPVVRAIGRPACDHQGREKE